VLSGFLALKPSDGSPRLTVSHSLCSVALEHAESAKILIVSGNFTSAVGLLRLQYEALVRAMWLRYAASEVDVQKLAAELTQESGRRAEKQPMLSEMLSKLEGEAPPEAMGMLLEFKEYSWKPLNSFVHSGMHAINRHSNGYPPKLLEQTLRASNGVSLMVGMLLVILSDDPTQNGKIPQVQAEFADCLPPPHGEYS
jgi:hypothetical protein